MKTIIALVWLCLELVIASRIKLVYFAGLDQVPVLQDGAWKWKNIQVTQSSDEPSSVAVTPLNDSQVVSTIIMRRDSLGYRCDSHHTRTETIAIKLARFEFLAVCPRDSLATPSPDICEAVYLYSLGLDVEARRILQGTDCAIFRSLPQVDRGTDPLDEIIEVSSESSFPPSSTNSDYNDEILHLSNSELYLELLDNSVAMDGRIDLNSFKIDPQKEIVLLHSNMTIEVNVHSYHALFMSEESKDAMIKAAWNSNGKVPTDLKVALGDLLFLCMGSEFNEQLLTLAKDYLQTHRLEPSSQAPILVYQVRSYL